MLDAQTQTELFQGFTEQERAVLNEHLSSMSRDELVGAVQFIKDDMRSTGRREVAKSLQRYIASRILQ